jgi:hypothetical protein
MSGRQGRWVAAALLRFAAGLGQPAGRRVPEVFRLFRETWLRQISVRRGAEQRLREWPSGPIPS